MTKGYIFDMDGVLCDSEEFIAAAAIRMFWERYQTEVTVEDFEPFVGAGEDRYLGGVAEKYGISLNLESDKAETYRLYGECVKGKLQAKLAGGRRCESNSNPTGIYPSPPPLPNLLSMLQGGWWNEMM